MEQFVGTLDMTTSRKAAFQYSDEWMENEFSISPFSLPLKKQVFILTKDYFSGLFGVFRKYADKNWKRYYENRRIIDRTAF